MWPSDRETSKNILLLPKNDFGIFAFLTLTFDLDKKNGAADTGTDIEHFGTVVGKNDFMTI